MALRKTQPVHTASSDTSRLLTIPEAAVHVRLSRTMLYKLMDDGLLAYVKIGKARRIALSALNTLIEKNTRIGTGETE